MSIPYPDLPSYEQLKVATLFDQIDSCLDDLGLKLGDLNRTVTDIEIILAKGVTEQRSWW